MYVSQQQQFEYKLSTREIEVIKLIAAEYTVPEIALELFISINTVKTHKKKLMEKLQVRSCAGLVRRGFEVGLFSIIKNKSRLRVAV